MNRSVLRNARQRAFAVLMAVLMMTAMMPVTTFAAGYSKPVIKAVQQTLNNVGLDCGTVDGVAGTKTREAVKKWQQLSGVDADGKIDDELLSEMHIKKDGSAVAGDSGLLAKVPQYSGDPYVEVNDNKPSFADDDLTTEAFEKYSDLDSLGRCGVAYANVCTDIMPSGERESIGSVKPSGWHTVKYEGIDGNYLYNRCHLIGYQLSAENTNEENLITGTRYLNVKGMLPFENMVADYVKETDNHVLYRVKPIFDGDNLVASGVEMEAESVEDKGDGISFHVFCYNVQPEIFINYSDGSSYGSEYTGNKSQSQSQSSNKIGYSSGSQSSSQGSNSSYQNNANNDNASSGTMVWISATGSKYHSRNNCGRMNPNNAHQESESQAISEGYEKCKKCW